MIILGIDPGLKGAFCLIKDEKVLEIFPMPIKAARKGSVINLVSIKAWLDIIHKKYPIDFVVIEKQIVVSRQGLSSSGKTMYQFGLLVGLCTGLDIDVKIVTAIKWQKIIFPKVDQDNMKSYNYGDTKIKSIAFVEQNYNSSYLYTTPRQRKPSDGIADAICIARAGLEL